MSELPEPPDSRAGVAELCSAAAAGDTAATEALLWRHHARLLGLARRKLGVEWQGKIDAEDLLQEAYVEVFAGISGLAYTDEDSFYRWASRIVDHKFIDHVRRFRSRKRDTAREARRPGEHPSTYDALLAECAGPSETPSRVLEREDAVAALLGGMAVLPEDYRLVLQRHYLGGETFAAIAADMQRSEEAVRKLAARGVEKLRSCLSRASLFFSRE